MYLGYAVVGGKVTLVPQSTINANCLWTAGGCIWSLDGPTLNPGFLCSIAVGPPCIGSGHVNYDKRPLDGTFEPALSSPAPNSAWGTAQQQPNGQYVIVMS